jgi:solute carrier family 35 protein F1/2
LCLFGLALLVTSDLLQDRYKDATQGNDIVIGDVLVLLGCICYGISNVGQEHLVKTFDREEFLAGIGVAGSIISGIQVAILERDALAAVPWTGTAICLILHRFLCMR